MKDTLIINVLLSCSSLYLCLLVIGDNKYSNCKAIFFFLPSSSQEISRVRAFNHDCISKYSMGETLGEREA